jgi:hypothetical protein
MDDELRDRLAARLTGEFADRPSTHVHVPPGWEPVVADLADHLDQVWPGWRLLQIKQKLAFLEVYLDKPPDELADVVHAAVRDATREAARVCERCGSRTDAARGQTAGYQAFLCRGCRDAGHRQLLADLGLSEDDLATVGTGRLGDLAVIVEALEAAEMDDDHVRPWLRTPNESLQGRTPLEAIADGDVEDVHAAVAAYAGWTYP